MLPDMFPGIVVPQMLLKKKKKKKGISPLNMFGNHDKIWTPLHLYNQSLLQTSDVPDIVLFFHWVRIVSILCSKEQQSQECSVKESFLIKCIWEMYIPYLEIHTKGSEAFCRKKLCLILMNTIVLKLIWSLIPFLAVGEAQISLLLSS